MIFKSENHDKGDSIRMRLRKFGGKQNDAGFFHDK